VPVGHVAGSFPVKTRFGEVMQSLEERYSDLCATTSDINEHLPLLSALAARYPHITEMGVRYGVSTIAFLHGKPKRLVSYDIRQQIDVGSFQRMASPTTEFFFIEADTLFVGIAETDVLFIDTLHTEAQLYAELSLHHVNVRHQIVMHDTTTFGEHGEGGGLGLNVAIRKFLGKHTEWWESNRYQKNNGLTILSRSAR
jgi:hypothetical protein